MPPAQLEEIRVGADAVLKPVGAAAVSLTGKAVNIGIAADRVTGKIPVLIRVENANEKLRCYIEVKVRFGTPAKRDEK